MIAVSSRASLEWQSKRETYLMNVQLLPIHRRVVYIRLIPREGKEPRTRYSVRKSRGRVPYSFHKHW
jgi:hypothetical protein